MNLLVHGYYGAGNAGDDAILQVMAQQVSRAFPGSRITVITSGSKPMYLRHLPVRAIPYARIARVRKAVREANAVILGGGGLLQDYFGVPYGSLRRPAKRGMAYYGVPFLEAARLGKPTMIYGVGVGPILTPRGALYAARLAGSARVITVRDSASAAIIKRLTGRRPQTTADPAVTLPARSSLWAQRYLRNRGVSLDRPLVAVVLRDWIAGTSNRKRFVRQMGHVVAHLARSGRRVILILFNKSKADMRLARLVRRAARRSSYVHILGYNCPPRGLKAILGETQFVIGMRLHALILATGVGVPAVGVAYDSKVTQYMKSVGLRQYVVPFQGITARRVIWLTDKLVANRVPLTRLVRTKVARLVNRERMNLAALLRMLKGRSRRR